MSRPWASVANGNSQLGGSSAFIRLASIAGSVSAIKGAKRATPMAIATRLPPTQVLEPHFIGRASAVTDARIDYDIGQADQRGDAQEEQHDHQDAALDRRHVALEDRIDHHRTDTRPGEQLLDPNSLAD